MNLREYFLTLLTLSKKERAGIIVLLVIYGVLWVLPFFFFSSPIPDDVLEITPLEIEKAKAVLQQNKVSSAQSKYRPQNNRIQVQQSGAHLHDTPVKTGLKRGYFLPVVDINQADSALFESLPGIGEKLSSRIVRYRERLGGFVSVKQLTEVYGLQDSVLQRFADRLKVSSDFSPSKINVNKASYDELKRHPYFGHALAKSLVAYRGIHGSFGKEDDLFGLAAVEADAIRRILPYCTFGQ